MAETTFYMYPSSNDGPYTNAALYAFGGIDDPYDGTSIGLGATPTDCAAWNAANDGSSYRNTDGSWGLGTPQSGVSINFIRVHFRRIVLVRGAGSYVAEPRFVGAVRPGGSSTYYIGTRTIVDDGGCLLSDGSYKVYTIPLYNKNTASWSRGDATAHVYYEFTTNPVTGLAWTVSALQNLLVSACFGNTAITFSPNPSMPLFPPTSGEGGTGRLGAIYVEVNANVAAASIEAQRAKASAYLRVHRNPREAFELEVPLHALSADVGDVVPVTHGQAPSVDGLGWGRPQWSRHYALILQKTLNMSRRTWRFRAMDMRHVHTRLWFPAITDQAYTEEGRGIPYLDSGGGRTMSRNSQAYVKKQSDDQLYAQVPVDKERWTPDGLAIFRAVWARISNNSFSQGSGSSFTGWTTTTSGSGTVAEETADYLFDANGLRRCIKLDSGTTASSYGNAYQDTVSLVAGYLRVHIVLKPTVINSGSDQFVWFLIRNSDGYYYNAATEAFQATGVANSIPVTLGEVCHLHHLVDSSGSGTSSYRFHVRVRNDSAARNRGLIYYANVWHSVNLQGVSAERLPFVTTTAQALEGPDLLAFENPASARCWDVTRGTALLTLLSAFGHGDLPSSVKRYLLYNYVDANNYEALYLEKVDSSTCRVVYDRVVSGSSVGTATATLTGDDRPSVDSVMKVAVRWQATDGELGNADYAVKVYVSTNGRDPVTGEGTVAPGASGTAQLFLGSTESSNQIDGYLRDIDVSPYVLTDDEVYRRLEV